MNLHPVEPEVGEVKKKGNKEERNRERVNTGRSFIVEMRTGADVGIDPQDPKRVFQPDSPSKTLACQGASQGEWAWGLRERCGATLGGEGRTNVKEEG